MKGMRHRVLAVLLLIAAAFVITPGTACACSCAPFEPKTQVEQSAAVFTGTVTGARQVEGDPLGPRPPIVYTFHADQVYRGKPEVTFQVAANSDSASCGYDFDIGARYLVFASAEQTGMFEIDPGTPLHTTLCSGNRMVRSGEGPLRPKDGMTDASPLTAELLAALGPAAHPMATTVPAPLTSQDGAGAFWNHAAVAVAVVVAVVVMVTGLAYAGWRLSRWRGSS